MATKLNAFPNFIQIHCLLQQACQQLPANLGGFDSRNAGEIQAIITCSSQWEYLALTFAQNQIPIEQLYDLAPFLNNPPLHHAAYASHCYSVAAQSLMTANLQQKIEARNYTANEQDQKICDLFTEALISLLSINSSDFFLDSLEDIKAFTLWHKKAQTGVLRRFLHHLELTKISPFKAEALRWMIQEIDTYRLRLKTIV